MADFNLSIGDTDLSKTNPDLLGNNANSTPSGTEGGGAPLQTSLGKESLEPRTFGKESLETFPSGADLSEEVSTVIDTTTLESGVGSESYTKPYTVQKFEPSAVVTQEANSLAEEELALEKDRQEVFDAMESIGDMGRFASRAEKEADIRRLTKEKRDIDNRILKAQREYDLSVRDTKDTFGTRAQKNAIINELTDKYNRRVADLSIIKLARDGALADAQAEVSRKVEMEMASRRAKVDALSFLYFENKERFTTQEQRQFEEKIRQEERAYSEKFAEKQNLENFKLKMLEQAMAGGAGNATLLRIQGASSMQDLMGISGIGSFGTGGSTGLIKPQIIKLEDGSQVLLDKDGNVIKTYSSSTDTSTIQLDIEEQDNNEFISLIDDLLSNRRGLEASSGAVQSDLVGGFFSGGLTLAEGGGFSAIARLTPLIGNIQGAVQTRGQAMNFKSGLGFLVNTSTFQELMDLKAGGATFGALTEGERIAIGRSANQLNSAVKVDPDGTVQGVNATEEKLEEYLKWIKRGFEAKNESINTQRYLTGDERAEIMGL